ncbi:hypothetical protein [Paraburkholderia sp.]|uniref:hypothetical protein n=1 Tax=Paraburkholderia sp. TaxID=1926495 RepID=UPI00239366F1|nr:hypothetical protein [Paraburkholderia sp.]MDE1183400.1 hypothetical protein [Paraburkholderia sp.]
MIAPTQRFHGKLVSNFLSFLLLNFGLLAAVLAVCGLCQWIWPDTALKRRSMCTLTAISALTLDAALTFLVFSDARNRYGQFSNADAFVVRALAYVAAGAIAVCGIELLHRARIKSNTPPHLVIKTSPYTDSRLPM